MADTTHNIIVNLIANIKNFDMGFKKAEYVLNNVNRTAQRMWKNLTPLGKQNNSIEFLRMQAYAALPPMVKLGIQMNKFVNRFQYWGLSVMFFGMQMQRTFTSIMKAGIDSFTRIMESSGYLSSSVQRLGVYWEYLKFTIGSALSRALEPLIPTIVKVVDKITEWIREHPKLTSALIIGGAAIGALLFSIGQIAITLGPMIKLLTGPGGLSGALIQIAAITIGTLGFIALMTAIEDNVNVGKSLSDLLNRLKDTFSALFSNIAYVLVPNASSAMEAFGYSIAWVMEVALNGLNRIGANINFVISMIRKAQIAWSATWLGGNKISEAEATRQMKAITAEAERITEKAFSVDYAKLVFGGAAGYYQSMKSLQENQLATNIPTLGYSRADMYTPAPLTGPNYTPAPVVITNAYFPNIKNVNDFYLTMKSYQRA